jgi:phage shock protein A
MADIVPFENSEFKQKSFWQRPEGVTGGLFMLALLGGIGYLIVSNIAALTAFVASTIGLVASLAVLGVILYMVLDPKMRNLVWYMYKSVMRKITGIFVNIDPIGVLESYVDDLKDNLRKMSQQIGSLKGQMRKLKGIMDKNAKEIDNNMKLASLAKERGKEKQMILSSRKAARLKEVNAKYDALHNKMQVLYRILSKMYQNSEILLEDTKDNVELKKQERNAIRASHSAMKSAMSVISGDPDKRAMFDMAMERVADDVANKVGEMERFMEMSSSFMDSVDLQNGVFEEEGMKMLEQYEKQSQLLLMGDGKTETLDLNSEVARPEVRESGKSSSYDNLFE